MEKLQMKLGENVGKILLEISQENLLKGNPENCITTYTKSLYGFTEDLVLELLRNKAVLVTCNSGKSLDYRDDPELLEKNQTNIYNWEEIYYRRLEELKESQKGVNSLISRLSDLGQNANDISLTEIANSHSDEECHDYIVSRINLAARAISGNPWSNLRSSGESTWNRFVDKILGLDAEGERWEFIIVLAAEYVKSIRLLLKDYINYIKSYEFLVKHGFIQRPKFIESTLEGILEILYKFADDNVGYHHPMCDEEIHDFKEEILTEILKTDFGNEYVKNKILQKDILDGYDAGWLSPEGIFYGMNGDTSSLLHVQIAEDLSKGIYKDKIGTDKFGFNNCENYFTGHSWLKIHHDEVYGYFRLYKDDKEDTRLFSPTHEQIKSLCKYADKFFGGKVYTSPQIVKRTEPVSTYKIRQADEFALRKIFDI